MGRYVIKSSNRRMKDELDSDSLKTKGGGGAFGFDINPQEPYSNQHEYENTERIKEKGIP